MGKNSLVVVGDKFEGIKRENKKVCRCELGGEDGYYRECRKEPGYT